MNITKRRGDIAKASPFNKNLTLQFGGSKQQTRGLLRISFLDNNKIITNFFLLFYNTLK
jgi:hypothetical protein